MLKSLTTLKSLVKPKDFHIDYPIFRLHYHGTVALLFGFCLILSAKVLFGDPIDCSSRNSGDNNFYDNLCYSMGTFTRYQIASNEIKANSSHRDECLKDVPLRSVKRALEGCNLTFNPKKKYFASGMIILTENKEKLVRDEVFWHHYYNYMSIVLFLMGALFYIPHYMWKNWESGIVSSVCKQIHEAKLKSSDFHEINQYLKSCFAINRHGSLVYKYFVCEILLLINLLLQVTALDMILNNQFSTYGTDFLYYMFKDSNIYGISGDDIDNINSPLDFVFPKLTACTIRLSSQGGISPDVKQFVCAVPMNILHDKFFLILWFWFVFLGIVTAAQIFYDILYMLMPGFRNRLFKIKFGLYNSDDKWNSRGLPELFLLDLIGTNSDRVAFMAFMRILNKEDWSWKNGPSITL